MPVMSEGVRSHYPGTAVIGEDRQAGVARPWLLGHQFRAIEKFLDGVYSHNACPFERGVTDCIFSCHDSSV